MLRRKLLTEFIDWFETSRRPYDQRDTDKCIAAQAGYWLARTRGEGSGRGDIWTLLERFGIPAAEASAIYSSVNGIWATRKVATAMLRRYVKTRRVQWL